MWHAVGKATEISAGFGRTVDAAGQKIALFNVQGRFCAIADTCPHRGGPLGEGYLEGSNVTCPWHAWEFDVTNGRCLTMEGAAQKTYSTKVENGQVWVDL